MRMDVNGDGTLTKREMLAAEEFTPDEATIFFSFTFDSPKSTQSRLIFTFTARCLKIVFLTQTNLAVSLAGGNNMLLLRSYRSQQ